MNSHSDSWIDPTIRVAAAGLGAAVAGPLGGVLGSWIGGALTGPAADLISGYAGKFGEKAGEKLLELGADSLSKGLKGQTPVLEDAYREALRLGLADVHSRYPWEGFDDWYKNWDRCLAASRPLNLPPISWSRFAPEDLKSLFQSTMERLDAQGSALEQKNMSLTLRPRSIPDALVSQLVAYLPEYLQERFRALIVQPKYSEAWKEAELNFQHLVESTIGRIDEKAARIDATTARSERKIDALPEKIESILTTYLDRALAEGRAGGPQANDVEARMQKSRD